MGPLGDKSPLNDTDSRSSQAWLEAVKREERRGELLAAFDLAERGLAEHPGQLSLEHRAVLALARAGATDEAASRFSEYGLDVIEDEDIEALGARIAKDFALREVGEERRVRAARAAERYATVFSRTGGYYPAINAATLWSIAGDRTRARELATVVLALLAHEAEDSYYAAATEAEAYLLLDQPEAAEPALGRAAARHGGDYGALATTRRQLRAICEGLAIDPGLLRPLAGPGVVYFCGHRTASEGEPGRFPADAAARCSASIANVIRGRSIGFAYGALAGGADILWAEALLAHGSELHIVLPFALQEFIQTSVAPCGPGWTDRCERLLAAATHVRYATDDAFLGDDVLFRYAGELAMGLALLRSRYLDAEVWQLALWDGAPARGEAGTAIDVATWQRTRHPATIVSPDGTVTTYSDQDRLPAENPSSPWNEPLGSTARRSRRVVRAMLFGDIKGFSKLTDEQLPTFATRVLGAIAEVVESHQEHVSYRNTWGDAIYLVLADAATAASCALDLQKAMSAIDFASEGLPGQLALRLGGHLGPVFPTYDPVLGTSGFMGSHVSRTARIEPVTPPGAVYVTEAFAAALILGGARGLTCDYVGHMSAAKSYGRLRMYRLRRINDNTPSHRDN